MKERAPTLFLTCREANELGKVGPAYTQRTALTPIGYKGPLSCLPPTVANWSLYSIASSLQVGTHSTRQSKGSQVKEGR